MAAQAWEKCIHRADQLTRQSESTEELLSFYAKLLRAQKTVYQCLRKVEAWLPSGDLNADLPAIRTAVPEFLHAVETSGPPLLVEEAQRLLRAGEAEIDELLLQQWIAPRDIEFFGKAFLQPYACRLVESRAQPFKISGDVHADESRCPSCAGRPQVSFLQSTGHSADGASRNLICASCLTPWSFTRVKCAHCGEERPSRLGYFHSPAYEHIRIEACDTCGHYIKEVDLTRAGLAVPLVDEVAGAALDLWAQEHGHRKIELNLVGL
ncbi:MAG TPA: formate dehydrogenase accessory protein FdhE [Acidobacteriota bacterium]|jgi:formate dehydrogenase maturation protein FdhE